MSKILGVIQETDSYKPYDFFLSPVINHAVIVANISIIIWGQLFKVLLALLGIFRLYNKIVIFCLKNVQKVLTFSQPKITVYL